ELAVEFKRARVDGERTRHRAGLGSLVDDAQLHSKLGQPEREDETGGPGADNEDIAPRHVLLHDDVFAPQGRNLVKIRRGTPRPFLLNSTLKSAPHSFECTASRNYSRPPCAISSSTASPRLTLRTSPAAW